MKKLLIISICISLFICSLSVVYYITIYLPRWNQSQKVTQDKINALENENSDIRSNIQDIETEQQNSETDTEDIQGAVEDSIHDELQNQSNCEGLGGTYQGGGTCVYY